MIARRREQPALFRCPTVFDRKFHHRFARYFSVTQLKFLTAVGSGATVVLRKFLFDAKIAVDAGGFGVLLARWPGGSGAATYYDTSSATLSLNTLDSVATNGSGNAVLLTATVLILTR